jgi:amino acid transporter
MQATNARQQLLRVNWSPRRKRKTILSKAISNGQRESDMTQQIQNEQGRMIKPLQAVLFILALLVFIFTVVYRMVKSASFSYALATLVESLLIVAFVIFFGILLSYLIYFLYQRFGQGPRSRQVDNIFFYGSGYGESTCTPESGEIELAPKNEGKSSPDSEC